MPLIPSIKELGDESRYEKVLTLPYGELAPFVLGKLRSGSKAITLVWVLTIVSALSIIWFWPGLRYSVQHSHIFYGLLTGFVILPLTLIPMHEILHLIPLRVTGARDIRFGMDLSQGIVYITAHRFVIGRKMFLIAAVAPFIIVSVLMVTAMLLCPSWWKWVLSISLLVHTTMCLGDAAMIAFVGSLRKQRVYTWDDADKKEAYFFIEKN